MQELTTQAVRESNNGDKERDKKEETQTMGNI